MRNPCRQDAVYRRAQSSNWDAQQAHDSGLFGAQTVVTGDYRDSVSTPFREVTL